MLAKAGAFWVLHIGNASFDDCTAVDDMAVLPDAVRRPLRQFTPPTWRDRVADFDWAPDLASDIGSLSWFRGLATFTLLSVAALSLLPDFGPLYGAQMPMPSQTEADEARAQMIMPIALGSDSGKRMAANDKVRRLSGSPERPTIDLVTTLGRGDSFTRSLERAGVSGSEAATVARMISSVADISAIEPGTTAKIRLGARASKTAPRPLEHLSFRARFDLNLTVKRGGGGLSLAREVIAVDVTPLRIHGIIGASLYRSARAAGAPADMIQSYLKIISGQTSISDLLPSDEFDIIMSHRRAATGESKVGEMLYAGVDRGGAAKVQMLKWTRGDSSQWFEASGVGQTRGAFAAPVNGHLSSKFGMRMHPILGYVRMHAGVDYGAPFGSPVFASADGTVAFAGAKGGYGRFVKIAHNGIYATGYGHLSRVVATAGQHVRQGQIVGYVGSSGLSTGPHLHYELFQNGRQINPLSVQYIQRAQLSGPDLASFRAQLAKLKSVKPGVVRGAVLGGSAQSLASSPPK
jgi:murein DD-endopeptidase MepM/ murein hydrolase activator NlpD